MEESKKRFSAKCVDMKIGNFIMQSYIGNPYLYFYVLNEKTKEIIKREFPLVTRNYPNTCFLSRLFLKRHARVVVYSGIPNGVETKKPFSNKWTFHEFK